MCRLKRFTPLFTTICRSQEVGQVGDQTALRENEEGAIRNVTGDLSNDHRGFLTILDNVSLLVGRPEAKSDLVGLSLNQQASQKELEGVNEKWRTGERRQGAPAVVRALQKTRRHRRVLC